MGQESRDNLKAYPAPEAGMKRCVMLLEPKQFEADYRVELQVGKTVDVDNVNRYFFGGTLEEVNVEGWGIRSMSSRNWARWLELGSLPIPTRPRRNALCRLEANRNCSATTAAFLSSFTYPPTRKSVCGSGKRSRIPSSSPKVDMDRRRFRSDLQTFQRVGEPSKSRVRHPWLQLGWKGMGR